VVTDTPLKAPFPYFGGKSQVADIIWARLGDVPNYVEPFAGSLAVLLSRPHEPKIETINDKDAMVSNFWRALRFDPDVVAHHADWPVNENDLHARHAWLVGQRENLTTRLEGDPDYYDPKIAGWWVWGICAWIGSGWCSGVGPWQVVDGELINRQRPHLGNAGQGINRQLPHLGDAGQGINRKLPHLGDAGQGIRDYLYQLSDRLRNVRVCSGDWSRVCGPSPTFKHGTTAVFLDPPYANEVRTGGLYALDDGSVAAEVREWAIVNGDNPLFRIALCGYDNEHGRAMPDTWEAVSWKASGGYAGQGISTNYGRDNAQREVVWFSPHCLQPDRQLQLW
jgi:DNA adenine methylase